MLFDALALFKGCVDASAKDVAKDETEGKQLSAPTKDVTPQKEEVSPWHYHDLTVLKEGARSQRSRRYLVLYRFHTLIYVDFLSFLISASSMLEPLSIIPSF